MVSGMIWAGAMLAISAVTRWPDFVSSGAKRSKEAGRYDEAVKGYERAARVVRWDKNVRAGFGIQVAICAFNAGRATETAERCTAAIALNPTNKTVVATAHNMAALGYWNMSDA